VDRQLLDRVRGRLVAEGGTPSAAGVAGALRREGVVLGDQALLAVVSAVRSELAGAGPLEPLLREPGVSDVLVNGPDEVWVDRGGGLERAAVRFPDEAAVQVLARRLAASAGRRLDAARPTVDARLAGGIRLHAVLPPLSPAGALVSLRVARTKAFGLEDLVALGTVAPALAGVLRRIVRSRLAFVVSGGTGSGKTTLLSTLLGEADPAQRVLLVEDSGELVPALPHVVRLEARTANAEGEGAVDLRELVRQALRMRPDRLVVGEVRGGEVVELLAALNTGHEGGCGTLHANTAADVPARMEALALAAGLPREALHSQLAAGLHLVVHLHRAPDGLRRVVEVGGLVRGADGLVTVVPALRVDQDGRVREGSGAAGLADLLAARDGTG
jgi:pilus assembly protein CpaF